MTMSHGETLVEASPEAIEHDGTDGSAESAPTTPGSGLRGHRLVWLVAAVAVVSLGAGVGLSTMIKSPAEQAAEVAPPQAGVVTAPVVQRVLANDVTMRADAAFEDAVEVKIPASDAEGVPAVVTGQVPEVGSELNPADVALEVSGRPVIVLGGDLPAYRTLVAGSAGPDVAQLKAALRALGIDPGKGAGKGDIYDAATAAAVQKLYAKVGYAAPSAGASADDAVRAAQEGATAAQQGLDRANADLAAGPADKVSDADKLEADNVVRHAQRDLATAQAEGGDVAKAQDDLALAQARRAELDKPRDTSSLTQAVTAAKADLRTAKEALAQAQQSALTPLPVSEVLFLANTPRRVDAVNVTRGTAVDGAVMSVSGATLLLEGSVAASDAKLLTVGATGTATLPDDSELAVTVASVEPKKADSGGGDSGDDKAAGRYVVALRPDALTPAQVEMLRGQNLRVVVPVDSTGGEVLAVPIAALTAGPGGESRVDVVRGKETQTITVTPGLAADGFVQITKADGDLKVGDKVVVGK